VRDIISHNKNPSNSWKKGLNEYSDMTEEEFFNYFHISAEQNCSATKRPTATLSEGQILKGVPTSWDWRDFGVVTPVKNQGKCGSCWTFSTVGSLEAHFMMKYGQFRNLSEQQLVDCAGDFDNHGCNGGLPSHAFEYIKYAGGITDETSYPYVANLSTGCQPQAIQPVVGVVGGSVNISTSEVDL
jgi:cathepsin H